MTMYFLDFTMKVLNTMNMILCALENQDACDALIYIHLTNHHNILIELKDQFESTALNYTIS